MFDLDKIGNISIAVLGDLAVDIHWYADMKQSELSRETPHYPLPVVREVTSLGAGGNVAANIAALMPDKLYVCGVCGDDWRGVILKKLLSDIGADTSGLITEIGRFTQAYCKPMRMGISDVIYEDPRLDFAAVNDISSETEKNILDWLDNIDGKIDALCVCDQFKNGVITPAVIEKLNGMKTPVYVDSRYRIGSYHVRGVLKPNEDECRIALRHAGIDISENPNELAAALSDFTNTNVLLTVGEHGSIYKSNDSGESIVTPAVKLNGEIDICGAGDTSMSAFACCMAAGASPKDAAEIAACASAVTIKKIGITGTATRNEIKAIYSEYKEMIK